LDGRPHVRLGQFIELKPQGGKLLTVVVMFVVEFY
jgi:hypothetical protein